MLNTQLATSNWISRKEVWAGNKSETFQPLDAIFKAMKPDKISKGLSVDREKKRTKD